MSAVMCGVANGLTQHRTERRILVDSRGAIHAQVDFAKRSRASKERITVARTLAFQPSAIPEHPRAAWPARPSPTLPRRVARALRSRYARFQQDAPFFLPVLGELVATTGRPTRRLARDLLSAWMTLRIPPREFARHLLFDVPGERWRDFVSYPELIPFFDTTVHSNERRLSLDKTAFAELHRGRGVPWPRTLAVINRPGGPTVLHARVINNAENFWPRIRELLCTGAIVLKPCCGQSGIGFYRISADGIIRNESGEVIDPDTMTRQVFSYTHRYGDYGYLAQPALDPHPDVIGLTGLSTLSALRVVTAYQHGRVHTVHAWLKIPAPGRLTDNFHGGVWGTLAAGVDLVDGRLSRLVGLFHPGHRLVIERRAEHPVTGRTIGGRELPHWREAIALAHRAHALHSKTATLAWDVVLAREGCVIIDGNTRWGVGAGQASLAEGLRPTLARLFPEYWG
jgi:hypothetical protein